MEEADSLCDRILIMDEGKSLVDGTAAEIKARGGRGHTFNISFHGSSDHYLSLLKSFPFVVAVEPSRDEFKLKFHTTDNIRDLLMALEPGVVKHLCMKEPTLEDVFIELTGRDLRD
jgi:ABC-2 type transport system ATP-binding protein